MRTVKTGTAFAQDIAEGIFGVIEVQNRIRLKREGHSGESQGNAAREGGRKTGSKAEG